MQTGRWGLWVVVVMAASFTPQVASAGTMDPPRVTATAAIVIDARTGSVLWGQSPDERLPPASTTKVMTAVLALESGRLRDRVEASPEACMVAPSKVNLRPGQRLVLEDLVYAILLNSANDASIAIAEHLASSVGSFGERMTARAHLLGATHTNFVNPHGLTQDGHYSTVRDLSTMFRYALAVPKFREIIVAVMGSRDLWGDTRRLIEFGFDGDLPPTFGPSLKGQQAINRTSPTRLAAARAQRVPQYAIQVGTFDQKEPAERLQRALDRRGFDVAVDCFADGRGKSRRVRYRVRVGPYQNRGQAESAARTMAAQVNLPSRVVQR